MKTFSINALGELLEKDRGLIVRALRGIRPDTTEKGQPRYRMAAAVAAPERHAGSTSNNDASRGRVSQERLNYLYSQYDAAYDKMAAAPTLKQRREIALQEIAVIMYHTQVALIEHGTIIDDEFCQGLLADKLYAIALASLRDHCKWSHDEAWHLMGQAMPNAEPD